MAAPAPPQGFVANALAAGGFQIKLDSLGNLGFFDSSGGEVASILTGTLRVGSAGTGAGIDLFNGSSNVPRFKGILTAGLGVPAIYAVASSVGNAALVANAINYVPPATAGTYRISAYVNVRTAAAVNMTVTVTYKDAAGVARSELLTLQQQNTATNVVNMNNTAGRFTGSYIFQIDNSATAVTVSTTGTTMTLYDLAATLEQLA
jgi:hypothetical protein